MAKKAWRCTLTFGALVILSMRALAAGDPVAGAALYINPNGAPLGCAAAACHGPDPTQNISKIQKGANNPSVIQNAINSNVGGMGFLKPYLSAIDVANIAAYIATPSGGTPAPAIKLSTVSLAFGNQTITTRSAPMTITVSNTGSAALTLANIAISGANAAEFDRSGTCSVGTSVAASGSCTIVVGFTPQAIGARSATLTLSHNASGGTSMVSLAGSGIAASGPLVSLSATSLAFASQAVGTTGTAQTLTLTNSGVADLSIASLALAGAHPADWVRAGTCAAGTLAAKASCTVTLAFAPTATGSRTASLRITSNAPNSPHDVPLAGTATAATTPVAALSQTMLVFGNYLVGTTSPAEVVTLANSGSAPLTIAASTITGQGFARTTTCGASLAPGASCTMSATFTPTAAGAVSGTLSISTNAPGSPHQIGLSGNGVAAGTVLPVVSLSNAALTFAAQTVNSTSAAQTVTLTNSSTVPLSITNFTLTGVDAADFSRAGTCTTPATIAAGGSCTLAVTFAPTAVGNRIADLNVLSNAVGSPSIALKGTGIAEPAPSTPAPSPTSSPSASGAAGAASNEGANVGRGGCSIASDGERDPLFALMLIVAGLAILRRRRRSDLLFENAPPQGCLAPREGRPGRTSGR